MKEGQSQTIWAGPCMIGATRSTNCWYIAALVVGHLVLRWLLFLIFVCSLMFIYISIDFGRNFLDLREILIDTIYC